ncbi:hypothetical protein BC938DRAFT_477936 [Jimgerdemannia flammicorona]|uniref:Uncharacterized protein n=1 Tax=Jimgerdemannia flammicorona TaxID=994334 RepID=A0A433QNP4_9FUNG|nr:hypothetical protein BC938DRAFT_477936 [Jimgerdemannia flammicorona]
MNYNSHSDTDHIHGPSCVHTHTPYHQTLDELDFQRSLHGACSQPDLARAQLLLDRKGARIVNERDANGYTPLMYDSTMPPAQVTAPFASFSSPTLLNRTRRRPPSSPRYSLLFSYLSLPFCSFPSDPTHPPETLFLQPLHRAASQGHLAVVRLLLSPSSGADPTIRDVDGRTAEDRAREAGFEEVAEEIARRGYDEREMAWSQ